MVLQLFTMGFEVFAQLHARTGAQAPCLAWLAKHLEYCNFGVSSLIELKFFGEWSLQLFTMEFEVFVCTSAGERAPYLAWLAKPLKCFDFGDHNF